MLRIVSVAFLDFEAFGTENFFIQTAEDEVWLYEAHTDGTVRKISSEPEPLRYVAASIEKFNSMYRCEVPVELIDISVLPDYLGRFEIISATACRHVS